MSTPKAVSIVAGGWSFLEVDPSMLPGYVIGVNDSCTRLAEIVDEGVTMDRLWTENRWQELLSNPPPRLFVRRNAIQNIPKPLPNWVHVYECDNGTVHFSDDAAVLNGTNSATVALNRAYQLKPQRIYLFGFDMCDGPQGQRHWYPDYPWQRKGKGTVAATFTAWAHEFDQIQRQLKRKDIVAINVSSRSIITSFQKVTPHELGIER